jgi:hypothetical protein
MKNLAISLLLIILSICGFAQNRATSIEINPLLKYDTYKEFYGWETGIGGKHYVKPKGLSYGLNISFKKTLFNDYNLSLGIGYFRYSFNKINSRSNLGTGNSRLIDFSSPLFILFYTDKYCYNTLSLNIGIDKQLKLRNNYSLITGLGLSNYYNLSQYYHLTSNSEGSVDYKKKNKQYFGLSAELGIGLLKKIKQFSIGPKIQIPVFSNWRTDNTFPNETNSGSRSKWFNGLGIGISCNYSLKKLKQ